MTELLPVLMFPQFNPVAIAVGPIAIRWYALAYIVSLVIGWRLMRRIAAWPPVAATPLQVDDFLTWATLGVVLGGRLGYVLFYQPSLYLAHPSLILHVWNGGMSFHGGALGVVIALAMYCWRQKLDFLTFSDRLCAVVPLGLGLGRVANFINGELWGRPAPETLPWAMIFPQAGPVPRHPSELYEALCEGVILLAVMLVFASRASVRARPGLLCGIFLVGYALARIFCEHFREPDVFLGFVAPAFGGITMGQILSLPMLLVGLALIWRARHRPAVAV